MKVKVKYQTKFTQFIGWYRVRWYELPPETVTQVYAYLAEALHAQKLAAKSQKLIESAKSPEDLEARRTEIRQMLVNKCTRRIKQAIRCAITSEYSYVVPNTLVITKCQQI